MKKFFNFTVCSRMTPAGEDELAGFLIEAETFVEAAIKAQDFTDELDNALQKKYPGKWKEGTAYLQSVYNGGGTHLACPEAIEEFVRTAEYEFD